MATSNSNQPSNNGTAVAKVVNVTGTVYAINSKGEVRELKADMLLYADERIDSSQGSIELAQDASIALRDDIRYVLNPENLPDEMREKFEKLVAEIDEQEGTIKLAPENMPEELRGLAENVAHISLDIVGIVDSDSVLSELQTGRLSTGIDGLASINQSNTQDFNITSGQDQAFDFGNDLIAPFQPPAFINESSFTTFDPEIKPALQLTGLTNSNQIYSTDIQAAMDSLVGAHPNSVLAIRLPFNEAQAFDNSPSVVQLPGAINPQASFSVADNDNGYRTELYTKADLDSAMRMTQATLEINSDNLTLANQQLQVLESYHQKLLNLEISNEQVTDALIEHTLSVNSLSNQLLTEWVIKNGENSPLKTAEQAVINWEQENYQSSNLTNKQKIAELETQWQELGGRASSMPEALQALYTERQPVIEALYQEQIEVHKLGEQLDTINSISQTYSQLIDTILEIENGPQPMPKLAPILNSATQDLEILNLQLQSQTDAAQQALAEPPLLMLRSGTGNDSDFEFQVNAFGPEANFPPLELLSNEDNINSENYFTENFTTNDNVVVTVTPNPNGIKTNPLGNLSQDSFFKPTIQVGPQKTSINIDTKLVFADPDNSESIVLEIPAIVDSNFKVTLDNAENSAWELLADNSLKRVVDKDTQAQGINDSITLNFDSIELRQIDLSKIEKLTLKAHTTENASIDPENSLATSDNVLEQEFTVPISLPGRMIALKENNLTTKQDVLNLTEQQLLDYAAPVAIGNELNMLQDLAELIKDQEQAKGSSQEKIEASVAEMYERSEISFNFTNVASAEPIRLMVRHQGPEFSQQQNTQNFKLSGNDLMEYIDAWNNAPDSEKDFYTQPLIVPAAHGATDFAVKVSSLVNGVANRTVLDTIDVIVDANADGITSGSINIMDVTVDNQNAILDIQLNLSPVDKDGSETQTVTIDLSEIFKDVELPDDVQANWFIQDNPQNWSLSSSSEGTFLTGKFSDTVGDIQDTVAVGFNSQALLFMQPSGNDLFEREIKLSAKVGSKEILNSNEQDFNLSNDQLLNQSLADITLALPIGSTSLKERQVDKSEVEPFFNSFPINLEPALTKFESDINELDSSIIDLIKDGATLMDLELNPNNLNAPLAAQLFNQRNISLKITKDEQQTNDTLVQEGEDIYQLFQSWLTAPDIEAQDKIATESVSFIPPKYENGLFEIEVLALNTLSNGSFLEGANSPMVGPLKILVDAVASELDKPPELSLVNDEIPIEVGVVQSLMAFNFTTALKDIDLSESALVEIQLPTSAGKLINSAPNDMDFNWDIVEGQGWSIDNNVLSKEFNGEQVISGPEQSIADTLTLGFNTQLLRFLKPEAEGGGILPVNIQVTTKENSQSQDKEFDFSDNELAAPLVTNNFDISDFIGLIVMNEFGQQDFIEDKSSLDLEKAVNNNEIFFENLEDSFAQVENRLVNVLGNNASSEQITEFFENSAITFKAKPQVDTVDFTQAVPQMLIKDENGAMQFLELRPKETGETDADVAGEYQLSGEALQQLYTAWQNSDDAYQPMVYVVPEPFTSFDFKFSADASLPNDFNDLTQTSSFNIISSATVIVDASAQGVSTKPGETPSLATSVSYVPDPNDTSDTPNANAMAQFKFDVAAKFIDATGNETHRISINLQDLFPEEVLQQVEFKIVAPEGEVVSAWSPQVTNGQVEPGVFRTTLSQSTVTDFSSSLILQVDVQDLPSELLDNFGSNVVNFEQLLSIQSSVVTNTIVDQEPDLTDNTLVYEHPDSQGTVRTVGVVEGIHPEFQAQMQAQMQDIIQQTSNLDQSFIAFNNLPGAIDSILATPTNEFIAQILANIKAVPVDEFDLESIQTNINELQSAVSLKSVDINATMINGLLQDLLSSDALLSVPRESILETINSELLPAAEQELASVVQMREIINDGVVTNDFLSANQDLVDKVSDLALDGSEKNEQDNDIFNNQTLTDIADLPGLIQLLDQYVVLAQNQLTEVNELSELIAPAQSVDTDLSTQVEAFLARVPLGIDSFKLEINDSLQALADKFLDAQGDPLPEGSIDNFEGSGINGITGSAIQIQINGLSGTQAPSLEFNGTLGAVNSEFTAIETNDNDYTYSLTGADLFEVLSAWFQTNNDSTASDNPNGYVTLKPATGNAQDFNVNNTALIATNDSNAPDIIASKEAVLVVVDATAQGLDFDRTGTNTTNEQGIVIDASLEQSDGGIGSETIIELDIAMDLKDSDGSESHTLVLTLENEIEPQNMDANSIFSFAPNQSFSGLDWNISGGNTPGKGNTFTAEIPNNELAHINTSLKLVADTTELAQFGKYSIKGQLTTQENITDIEISDKDSAGLNNNLLVQDFSSDQSIQVNSENLFEFEGTQRIAEAVVSSLNHTTVAVKQFENIILDTIKSYTFINSSGDKIRRSATNESNPEAEKDLTITFDLLEPVANNNELLTKIIFPMQANDSINPEPIELTGDYLFNAAEEITGINFTLDAELQNKLMAGLEQEINKNELFQDQDIIKAYTNPLLQLPEFIGLDQLKQLNANLEAEFTFAPVIQDFSDSNLLPLNNPANLQNKTEIDISDLTQQIIQTYTTDAGLQQVQQDLTLNFELSNSWSDLIQEIEGVSKIEVRSPSIEVLGTNFIGYPVNPQIGDNQVQFKIPAKFVNQMLEHYQDAPSGEPQSLLTIVNEAGWLKEVVGNQLETNPNSIQFNDFTENFSAKLEPVFRSLPINSQEEITSKELVNYSSQVQTLSLVAAFEAIKDEFDITDASALPSNLGDQSIALRVFGGVKESSEQTPDLFLASAAQDAQLTSNFNGANNTTTWSLTGDSLVAQFAKWLANDSDSNLLDASVGITSVRYFDQDFSVQGAVNLNNNEQIFLPNTYVITDAVAQGVEQSEINGIDFNTNITFERNSENELTNNAVLQITIEGSSGFVLPDPSSETHEFILTVSHPLIDQLDLSAEQLLGSLFSIKNSGPNDNWQMLPTSDNNLDAQFSTTLETPAEFDFIQNLDLRVNLDDLEALGLLDNPEDAFNFNFNLKVSSTENPQDAEVLEFNGKAIDNNEAMAELATTNSARFVELNEAQFSQYDKLNSTLRSGTNQEAQTFNVNIKDFLLELESRFNNQDSKIKESELKFEFGGTNVPQVIALDAINKALAPNGKINIGTSAEPEYIDIVTIEDGSNFSITGEALLAYFKNWKIAKQDGATQNTQLIEETQERLSTLQTELNEKQEVDVVEAVNLLQTKQNDLNDFYEQEQIIDGETITNQERINDLTVLRDEELSKLNAARATRNASERVMIENIDTVRDEIEVFGTRINAIDSLLQEIETAGNNNQVLDYLQNYQQGIEFTEELNNYINQFSSGPGGILDKLDNLNTLMATSPDQDELTAAVAEFNTEFSAFKNALADLSGSNNDPESQYVKVNNALEEEFIFILNLENALSNWQQHLSKVISFDSNNLESINLQLPDNIDTISTTIDDLESVVPPNNEEFNSLKSAINNIIDKQNNFNDLIQAVTAADNEDEFAIATNALQDTLTDLQQVVDRTQLRDDIEALKAYFTQPLLELLQTTKTTTDQALGELVGLEFSVTTLQNYNDLVALDANEVEALLQDLTDDEIADTDDITTVNNFIQALPPLAPLQQALTTLNQLLTQDVLNQTEVNEALTTIEPLLTEFAELDTQSFGAALEDITDAYTTASEPLPEIITDLSNLNSQLIDPIQIEIQGVIANINDWLDNDAQNYWDNIALTEQVDMFINQLSPLNNELLQTNSEGVYELTTSNDSIYNVETLIDNLNTEHADFEFSIANLEELIISLNNPLLSESNVLEVLNNLSQNIKSDEVNLSSGEVNANIDAAFTLINELDNIDITALQDEISTINNQLKAEGIIAPEINDLYTAVNSIDGIKLEALDLLFTLSNDRFSILDEIIQDSNDSLTESNYQLDLSDGITSNNIDSLLNITAEHAANARTNILAFNNMLAVLDFSDVIDNFDGVINQHIQLLDDIDTNQEEVEAQIVILTPILDELNALLDTEAEFKAMLKEAQTTLDETGSAISNLDNEIQGLILDLTQLQNGLGTDQSTYENLLLASGLFDNANFTAKVTGMISNDEGNNLQAEDLALLEETLMIISPDIDSEFSSNLSANNTQLNYAGEGLDNATNPFNVGEKFDFNAITKARIKTQLNLNIDFEKSDPNDEHIVTLQLDKRELFDWQLVPAEENGWTLNKQENTLTKNFKGTNEGKINEVVGITYSPEAYQYFDLPRIENEGLSGLEQNLALSTQVGLSVGSRAFSKDSPSEGFTDSIEVIAQQLHTMNLPIMRATAESTIFNRNSDIGQRLFQLEGGNDVRLSTGDNTYLSLGDPTNISFRHEATLRPELNAEHGNDFIVSGQGRDWIEAGLGNDIIYTHGASKGTPDEGITVGVASGRSGITSQPLPQGLEAFSEGHSRAELTSLMVALNDRFNGNHSATSQYGSLTVPHPLAGSVALGGLLFDYIYSDSLRINIDSGNYRTLEWGDSKERSFTFNETATATLGSGTISINSTFTGEELFGSDPITYANGKVLEDPWQGFGIWKLLWENDFFSGTPQSKIISGQNGWDTDFVDFRGMKDLLDYVPNIPWEKNHEALEFKITDIVTAGGGDDTVMAHNPDAIISNANFDSNDVGTIRDPGALIFLGAGDDVIFSGQGANTIFFDNTDAIDATNSGQTKSFLKNVTTDTDYRIDILEPSNAEQTLDGVTNEDRLTIQTFHPVESDDPTSASDGTQNTNIFDIDESLRQEARMVDNGKDTYVAFNLVEGTKSADLGFYFDVEEDQINLSLLFDQLGIANDKELRDSKINLEEVNVALPFELFPNEDANENNPQNTTGPATRVSITDDTGNTYYVIDLAGVAQTEVAGNFDSIFLTDEQPTLPDQL